jgi:hypothetical protein
MAYNDGIGGIGLRQTEVTLPTRILILNVDHISGDTRYGLWSGFVEGQQQEITVESASTAMSLLPQIGCGSCVAGQGDA